MSDTTDTSTGGTDTGDDTGAGDNGTGSDDGVLKLTQAQLDDIIDRRLARDRRARDRQPKDDPKPDTKDKKGDGDDLQSLREELQQLRVERAHDLLIGKAEKIAVTPDVGAKPERARAVVQMADLNGLTAADTEDIQDAIAAVLDEYPEWRKGDDDDEERPRRRARRSTRDDTNDRPAPSQTKASKAEPGLPRLIAAYEENSSKAG